MGSKMIKTRTDPKVHTAPEGWFPTNLTRAEKREYVEYHKNRDWAATNRWAGGSPRNPMPEIINQNEHDRNIVSKAGQVLLTKESQQKVRDRAAEFQAQSRLYPTPKLALDKYLKDIDKKKKNKDVSVNKVTLGIQ